MSAEEFKTILSKTEYSIPVIDFDNNYVIINRADPGPMREQAQKVAIDALGFEKGKLVNAVKTEYFRGEADNDHMDPFVIVILPKSALK